MTTTEVHHSDAHHEEHEHHVCSSMSFVGILGALMFLTFVTVWISRFDFGGANMWIAMAVAAVKASLVIAVFMHVLWDTTINRIFFLSSFLFLALLFLFCFADLLARGDMVKAHTRTAPLDYTLMPELSAPGTSEEQFQRTRAEHEAGTHDKKGM